MYLYSTPNQPKKLAQTHSTTLLFPYVTPLIYLYIISFSSSLDFFLFHLLNTPPPRPIKSEKKTLFIMRYDDASSYLYACAQKEEEEEEGEYNDEERRGGGGEGGSLKERMKESRFSP